jgi:hypothetical protein
MDADVFSGNPHPQPLSHPMGEGGMPCTAIVEVVRKLRRNAAVPRFPFTHFNEFGFVSGFGFRLSDFRLRRAAAPSVRLPRVQRIPRFPTLRALCVLGVSEVVFLLTSELSTIDYRLSPIQVHHLARTGGFV